MTDGTNDTMASSDSVVAAEVRSSFVLRMSGATGGLVATLLTTVVVVRTLDTREAVGFLAVLAALMIGPMVGKLGLGQNVIRLLAGERDPDGRRGLTGSHLRASALLAVLSSPIIALVALASLTDLPSYLLAVVLTTVILVAESLRLLLSDIFAAVGDVRGSVGMTHHVRSIVVLVALAAVAALDPHPDLVAFLAVYSVVGCLLVAVGLFRGRHIISLFGRSMHGGAFTMIGAGVFIFVLDASMFVVGRGDVWLAAAGFAPFDAARYGTVSVLAYQVAVVAGLASLAVMPVVARMWAAGERESVFRLLSATATLATAATTVIVIGLLVFGKLALGIAYGQQFADSYGLLAVLAFGNLGQAAFGYSVPLLLVSGQVKRAVIASFVALAVVVPVAVVAALWFGPVALAFASAAASIVLPLAQWLAARRPHPEAPRPSWNVAAAWQVLRHNGQPQPVKAGS
jgi:O-antigen/teichoic acid export membrane protein